MTDANLRKQLIRLAHDHPEFRRDLLPLLKEAAKAIRVKRDIKLKSGAFVAAGSMATVEFDPNRPSLSIIKVQGENKPLKVSTIHLHEYFDGFQIPPMRSVLRRWAEEGISETPTGEKAEATGWAKDGSPAWTLVLKDQF